MRIVVTNAQLVARQCSTCGKTKGDEGVKQLSLCSRCSDVWYCGAECSKKGWKTGGHKQLCGRLPVEQPIKLTEMSINVLTSEMLTGVSIIDNTAGDSLLVLARDSKKSILDGEVYDVLTNETVEIVQDQNGANTDGGMMRDLMAALGLA